MKHPRAMLNILYGAVIIDGKITPEEIELLNDFLAQNAEDIDFDVTAHLDRLTNDVSFVTSEMNETMEHYRNSQPIARINAIKAVILVVQGDGEVSLDEFAYLKTLADDLDVDIQAILDKRI